MIQVPRRFNTSLITSINFNAEAPRTLRTAEKGIQITLAHLRVLRALCVKFYPSPALEYDLPDWLYRTESVVYTQVEFYDRWPKALFHRSLGRTFLAENGKINV